MSLSGSHDQTLTVTSYVSRTWGDRVLVVCTSPVDVGGGWRVRVRGVEVDNSIEDMNL